MYLDDHAPPHFHVAYGGAEASIRIAPVGLKDGRLPPRVLALVVEWASLHEVELAEKWDRIRRGLPVHRIAPLE
jgi:hypothetical protein